MLDILELIPSKDVREYIKETGRVFTDFKKATIIYHLELPISERNEHLQKIADTTKDAVLRAQISEHITTVQDSVQRFKTDTDGYVYEVDVLCLRYTNALLAYEAGTKAKRPFTIKKHPVVCDQNYLDELTTAEMKYDKNGILTGLRDYTGKYIPYDPSRFEYAYVDIPHPFKAGDIVKTIKGYFAHGIVAPSQNQQDQQDQTDTHQSHELFSDATIPVDFVAPNSAFVDFPLHSIRTIYAHFSETI